MKKVIQVLNLADIPNGTKFTANWIYDDIVWSSTYQIVGEVQYRYNPLTDDWDIEENAQVMSVLYRKDIVKWFYYIA